MSVSTDLTPEALTGLIHQALDDGRYRLARAWTSVLIEMADEMAAADRTVHGDHVVDVSIMRDAGTCKPHGMAAYRIGPTTYHRSTLGECVPARIARFGSDWASGLLAHANVGCPWPDQGPCFGHTEGPQPHNDGPGDLCTEPHAR